jgi:cation:H+ antiporter
MVIDLLIFVVSLAALLYSADSLIDSACQLAERLKISPMVVGLTIVAVGTSLPEVMASAAAALGDKPEIAVGNVVGSNICNVALILGLPAIFYNITCRRRVLKREGSIMLAVSGTFLLVALFLEGFTRVLGVGFIVTFFSFIAMVFVQANKESGGESEAISATEGHEPGTSLTRTILLTCGMLVLLLASSKFLVDSTVALATAVGVSEAVIAISLIAFGTSLPELSVSISAARKKQGDILVGNILGSNISNILLVLGVTSVIKPFEIQSIIRYLDIPIMFGLACMMYFFLYSDRGIDRNRGIVLLSVYAGVILRCIFIGNS